MIIVLSPAKALDFRSPVTCPEASQCAFLEQAQMLIEALRKFSPAQLASLLRISDPLAVLNVTRYAEWMLPFTAGNARQAILAFNGDVYEGLAARSLSLADLHFAQGQLRILSGLYGLLRPLDLIQAYRLEMGTRLVNPCGKDLYAFWGMRISEALSAAIAQTQARVLVNLASEEYFRVVQAQKLGVPVVQPVFEDWGGGRYRVVSFYAKRARGLMARYAIIHRLREAEGLRAFAEEGYQYAPEVSSERVWVFRRRPAA